MIYKSLIAIAALGAASPAIAQTISIGTSPQGSSSYLTGAAVAKVASEAANIRARVVPQGGSLVAIPLIDKGQLTFAIVTSPPLAIAWAGGGPFKGKKQQNVRVVTVLRTLRTALMTRKDSGIKTVADIKGKRVAAGFPRSRTAGLMMLAKLAAANVSMKDVKPIPVPTGVRGVADLMAGKLDVTSFSLTSGKTREAHAAVGIRFISIPDTPASVKAMLTVLPGTFIETVKPSPQYPGITGPTNILAAKYLLVVSAKASDDLVYKMTKALHDNKKMLVGAFKAMAGFVPGKMRVDVGVPYHPGALKYYKEIGQ